MKTNKGFTLIELIIYISLVSIMLLGIASFSRTILQTRAKNQVIAEVEQQGIQIAQILSQKIRNAENIIAPTLGNNANSLTLDVVAVAQDPTVFSLDAETIKIEESGANQINLTNSKVIASGLVFQNLSRTDTPGIVKFSFTLDYDNQSGRPKYNYSKTFYGSISLR
ncbi:MAG: prepilin-type N-terminal cleavage/methylation domain-containing protein [Parcubacteria group bacterium]|nr:prepilin-type N-terminal cleavage/methylation domain-containing protein [Parcubacteria group bacterium]